MRDEFTGMLPAAIVKFEALLDVVPGTRVTRGFSSAGGEDDLRTWGVVCDLSNADMETLIGKAEKLGIEHLGNGVFAYTGGLTIEDFKTYRVNGSLELMPEPEPEPEIEPEPKIEEGGE